jgi:hypothetical protein
MAFEMLFEGIRLHFIQKKFGGVLALYAPGPFQHLVRDPLEGIDVFLLPYRGRDPLQADKRFIAAERAGVAFAAHGFRQELLDKFQ